LAALPKRYLVDVHAVVLRDPPGPRDARAGGAATARMHVLTAGGLVLAAPLALLQGLTPLRGPWLAVLLLAALAMMAAGVALGGVASLARASGQASSRCIRHFAVGAGRIGRVPAARDLRGPGFRAAGSVDRVARPRTGRQLGAWACAEIFTGVSWGPMRHALAGALHLAFHPRPARFDGAHIDAALQPLALDSDPLGVRAARDFRWNQLLGFDACVQCGRCEAACPAHAAGLPLNPKKLIQDLASAGTDRVLIGSDAAVDPDTLWACTTCRACVFECPMMIEHVDAVIDLRRFQTLELGATPGKAVQALQELRSADTVCGRSTASRLDWAADLKLRQLAAGAAWRRVAVAGRGGILSARPAHAAGSGAVAAAGRGRLRGSGRRRAGLRRPSRAASATRRRFAQLARRNVATLASRRSIAS